jgi:hypothetical protein
VTHAPGHLVLLGLFEVQHMDLLHCRHWHASVHGSEDLSLHLAVEPVRKPPETLMQILPVFDPIGDGWRGGDGAEASDVLVTHFTVAGAG